VVKHSEATEVRLRASMTDNILEISIHDDGVGLGDTPRGPGADGLWNMRQRVENAGGKFQIASDAKSGTIITVEMNLPLNGALKEASPKS
jgi:signal transduction histidine kinase